ncbi:hypothetical protein J2S00_002806 [Caldalkalibacillus uzonensis]|uniref:Uncharacterized protein n=1 Tax=Caldalkalibacillus uzonensis TaxID=353224 RepID=A0ABU0CUB4_9BACI|nr:hypothetical protein [Caldalkalibacillus uzonensis]MDQ0340011.1 hypothetical protein [Caldalkalibacillus uzonensis]
MTKLLTCKVILLFGLEAGCSPGLSEAQQIEQHINEEWDMDEEMKTSWEEERLAKIIYGDIYGDETVIALEIFKGGLISCSGVRRVFFIYNDVVFSTGIRLEPLPEQKITRKTGLPQAGETALDSFTSYRLSSSQPTWHQQMRAKLLTIYRFSNTIQYLFI